MYSGNRLLDGGTDRVDEVHRGFWRANVPKYIIEKRDGRIEKKGMRVSRKKLFLF